MKNNNNPRVVFVNTGALEDGQVKTTTFVKSQAESLAKGYDIQWFLLENNTSFSKIKSAIKDLRALLHRDGSVQLIHAHYGSMTSYIAAQAMGRLPLVVSYGGDDLLGTIQPGIKWRIRELIAKRLSYYSANRASAIIVKSQNLLNALPPKAKAKATIIPNGVDTNLFCPLDKAAVRKELDLGLDKKFVLFNGSRGNNIPVKNRPLAEASMHLVQKKYPDAELLVVGGIPQATLVKYMQASDALILTSLHEGSPNIVKEAMSCNLPVVSVNCGDVSERLAQVNMGGFFDYDPEQLAKALMDVFESSTSYNGREEVFRQELSQEAIANKINSIYQTTLNN